jgi:dienelactone hydrolase
MEGRSGMAHVGRSFFWAVGLSVLAPAFVPGPARSQDLSPGRVVERVACFADAGRSYALYLPSAFDPGKTWPLLVLFDSGARGPLAIEAFRDAAETHGWILAASNDSRNGPLQDSARAAFAVWVDVSKRFPVDERRVYATGFSGGARVASVFPRVVGRSIAGIIGCGAGLSSGLEPGTLGAAAYFGLAGLADFNYGEMKALDRSLDPSGIPHRFHYFEGSHAWPDPASCARAVAWMEIMAMKQGLRPADREQATAFIRRELEEAEELEASGRIFWAADRFEAATRLAEGLDLDIPGFSDLPGRVEGLKARKEYGQFIEAEQKRDRRAAEFREAFGGAFGTVEDAGTGGAPAVPKVLREAGIAFLMKEAKGKGSIEERAFASRLLFDFMFAARVRASELYGKGDLVRAAAYLDLAIAACEEGLTMERALHYDRACLAARTGDKELALRHLAIAVDKGVTDLALLEKDKDLDPIRDTDAFRAILGRLRTARDG